MTKEEYDKEIKRLYDRHWEAVSNGFFGLADRILEQMIVVADKQKRLRV